MYRYLAALFCALVVACGGAPEPAVDSMPAAEVPAAATAETEAEGGADFVIDSAVVEEAVMRLEGSGSLPDGALLSYEIKDDGFDVADYDGYETGQIEFTAGSFSFEMSVLDWPTGAALIRLVFELDPSGDPQPAAVTEAYGSDGAGLSGPNVEEFGGRRTITVTGEAEIS
jgi:hypothetical protein